MTRAICIALVLLVSRSAGADVHPTGGDVDLSVSSGAFLMFPHGTIAARVGLGDSVHVAVRYRTVTLLNHSARAAVGTTHSVGRNLLLGALLRTEINNTSLADGIYGIEFSSVALGNDWEAGVDAQLGPRRSGP